MSTYQELLDYYKNLLIIQYNDKEKAKATIEALAAVLLPQNEQTGNLLHFDVRDAFNIETASGVQLDILGLYIGVNRLFQGQTFEDTFFGFTDETITEPTAVTGFADETDFSTKVGEFLANEDVLSQNNQLIDDDYRFILKLKIIQNNINHGNKSIDDSLFEFFGTSLYMTDNENMTMTYFVPVNIGALLTVILEKNLLPKPMGVGINNIIPIDTYFSFADEMGSVASDAEGFADESDFLTKDGTFLLNNDIIA